MLMNLHLIAQGLENDSIELFANIKSSYKRLTLKRVEIYDKKLSLEKDVCYILDSERFLQANACGRGFSFICVGDMPFDTLTKRSGSSVLGISSSNNLSIPLVLSKVQKIFEFYATWERQLNEIVLTSGSIDRMIKESTKVFNNVILVHDREFTTISLRDCPTAPILDESWTTEIGSSCYNGSFAKEAKYNKSSADPFGVFEPEFWTAPDKPLSLTLNVMIEGKFFVRIIIAGKLSKKGVREIDYPLLAVLGRYVSLCRSPFLKSFGNGPYAEIHGIMHDLLEEKPVNEHRLAKGMQVFGCSIDQDVYSCIVLQLANENDKDKTLSWQPFYYVFSTLRELLPESAYIQKDQQIVGLINTACTKVDIAHLGDLFANLLKKFDLVMGVSNDFKGLQSLSNGYKQTCRAIEFGTKDQRDSSVFYFEEYKLTYALNRILEDVDPYSICPNGLLMILKNDREHKTNLFETVRAYVRNRYNLSKTCKELYINKSTLQYRINKAKKILSLNVDDPDAQLQLLLFYKLLDASDYLP